MSMERAGKSYLPAAPLGRRQLHHHGSQIRPPRAQIRPRLRTNRPCWAQTRPRGFDDVLSLACAVAGHINESYKPYGKKSSGQHFCVHSIFIHLFSFISYQTHTHTTHHCNTTQGRFKYFEWTAIMRPLVFFPPGFVDLPRHANTHTHTLANAPWPTCAMESFVCNDAIAAVSSPRLPSRPHPTTVSNYWLNWTSWPERDSRSP